MNLATLKRLTKLWQKRLKLQDWTIDIHFSRDITDAGTAIWHPENRTAQIEVLSPDLLAETGDEVEDTLVHELLHVLYDGHARYTEDSYSLHQERAHNQVAAALVRAYSRKKKDDT